ncbi:hypothetical protein QQ045_001926 [Rhodiola kirilowii]
MKVLDGGPWTGDGWAIAVGDWDVDRLACNANPTKVPMWVQVHNLPLALIQEKYEDRFGMLIEDGEEPLWVDFKYERLPKYCLKCARLSHDTSSCSVRNLDSDGFLYAHLRAELFTREGKKDGRKSHLPKEAVLNNSAVAQSGLGIVESQGVKGSHTCFGREAEASGSKQAKMKEKVSVEICEKSNDSDSELLGRKRDGEDLVLSK